MTQWPAAGEDPALGVEYQLQANSLGRDPGLVGGEWLTAQQASKQLVTRGQNCTLEMALRLVGRLGTGPTTGNTRRGSTWVSFWVG